MDLPSVSAIQFRRACSRFPTGVTVTTALGENGEPHGVTVSSFTTVSLDPPLVLVCIDHRSQMLQHLKVHRCFGVNVLSDQQVHLSVKFSRDWKERFDEVPWFPGHEGIPLLYDVPAAFECRTAEMMAQGDHIVFVGLVLRAFSSEVRPLTYINSAYQRVAW